jgi:hypothetical protein
MAERAIEDGFVDCPKYGVIDALRCLPSCEFQATRDDNRVVCYFGEEPPAEPADEEAEPVANEA